MKTIKNVNGRKLSLDKTTIRALGTVELSDVRGGLSLLPNCSIGLNFCPIDRR